MQKAPAPNCAQLLSGKAAFCQLPNVTEARPQRRLWLFCWPCCWQCQAASGRKEEGQPWGGALVGLQKVRSHPRPLLSSAVIQLPLAPFFPSKMGPAVLPFLPGAVWAILVSKRRTKSISVHWHVYRNSFFAVAGDTKFNSSKSLNKINRLWQ